MSDSQHTPGPWMVHEGDPNGFVVGPAEGPSVAWCGRNYNTGHGETPYETNARLIAAAPDLLAALQSIHKAVVQHGMEHSDFGIDIGTMAVEAIDKATGNEHSEPT